MNTDETVSRTLIGIDKALNEKCELHGFRSGGGLRVIRITKAGKLTGYGEHPDVSDALFHAAEDYLAGGRQYSEVYGEDKIYPHYLTGASTPTDELDGWLLSGHTIDAKNNNGLVEVTLKGIKLFHTPKHIDEKVRESQTPIEWEARGFKFRTSPGDWYNGKMGISTSVIKEAGKGKDAWHYNVVKVGKDKDFISAMFKALEAEEIEL